MKIVIDRKIPGLEEALRAEIFKDIGILALEGKDIRPEHIADADALLVRTRTRCDASLLDGSKVKLIGTATIGTDHIDLDWCRSNNISVVNAPGCNAPAVMQYVASCLHEAGFNPARHTLGVIGKGNIGSLVTELYRRAGCKVLVCDPPRKDAGFTDEDYISLEALLENSDAVTFHVPYTKNSDSQIYSTHDVSHLYPTHHLLSGELPDRPKIIVNASRGPIIDYNIIFKEWERRKFIIDTWPFEEYPDSFNKEDIISLLKMAFISTPHIAGYSIEGKRRATDAMLNAIASLSGNTCSPCRGSEFHKISYLSEVKAKALIPLQTVIDSFSPTELSKTLKRNPLDFEFIRSSHLRHEPHTDSIHSLSDYC